MRRRLLHWVLIIFYVGGATAFVLLRRHWSLGRVVGVVWSCLSVFLILISPQTLFAEGQLENHDPDPSRVFWSPTALHKEKGTTSVTNFDLAVWNIEHSLSDNLTVGGRAITPIGAVSAGPILKFSQPLAPKLRLGLWAEGGAMHTFAFSDDGGDFSVLYYGGGPILTYGDADRLLNFSVITYGGHVKDAQNYIVIPNVGGGIRLGRRVKLNLELLSFVHHESVGKNWAFLYGIRIFGERIYGDLGFVAPIAKGAKSFYKVMPLGYPLLSLGFAW